MISLLISLNVFFCDIKGEVKNPGVYKVDNNNINDIIVSSGGLTKNAYVKNINLSKKVTDEMVIYIPSKKEAPKICPPCICPVKDCSDIIMQATKKVTTSTTLTTKLVTTKKVTTKLTTIPITTTILQNNSVNINTASKEELIKLNGVGEVIAERIILKRQIEPFKCIEDILEVTGIGNSIFVKIKDFITV